MYIYVRYDLEKEDDNDKQENVDLDNNCGFFLIHHQYLNTYDNNNNHLENHRQICFFDIRFLAESK